MKKRLLAMLLALMLVVGLLPVGVLADGQIYEGNETFSYHITDSSLQAMVEKYNQTGGSSNVESVSITFNDPYTPGGQETFSFSSFGYTIALSNTNEAVQPNDIDHLTIELADGTSLTVPSNDLDWTWVDTRPLRYDLRLKAEEGTSTVTFYYQETSSGSYVFYREVNVTNGSAVGAAMPGIPDYIDNRNFVCWETGSSDGNGVEFLSSTIVNDDISVYARTVSLTGASQYHVINENNSFYEWVKDYHNDTSEDKVTTEGVVIRGFSVVGTNGSTKYDYDIGAIENGWNYNYGWYMIWNNVGITQGERVLPGTIVSLTVYATVNGKDVEYTIDRSLLDLHCLDDTIVEIYLREATEPETPVEPDPQPDPEPETNPDVRNVSVVVDCKTNDEHDKTVNIIEGSCTFNKAWDGEQWTCTVEIIPNSYVTDDTHTLDPESQTGKLLYVYADNSWQYVGDGTPTVTFTVECETPEQPNVYKINVTVQNGTATFRGIEVTSHILAAENEDITITFTPD